jgi:Tol biopolymer transport system component
MPNHFRFEVHNDCINQTGISCIGFWALRIARVGYANRCRKETQVTSHLPARRVIARTTTCFLAFAITLVFHSAAPADELLHFKIKRLTELGGRLAWYAGPAHELIAYDAIVNDRSAATEVFVMEPDGSGVRCVTCKMNFPKGGGFVGQPAWHPDGKHLVIQVENTNSKHKRFNHMSWGIDADLWLIDLDGERAERIWASAPRHAALHPHFSDDGRLIVFAERTPTPRVTRRLFHPWAALDGQNPWDGWSIHIASADIGVSGEKALANHHRITPNGGGFYETHSISPEGRIVYSFTKGGAPYVDDIFQTDKEGHEIRYLIDSPVTWDEHGAFSPNGRNLAFMSSRADPKWRTPRSAVDTLTTELFVRSADGRIHQLTTFNKEAAGGMRYLVSDFDWDRSGRRIAFQLAPVSRSGKADSPQIWLLEFSLPPP